MFNAVYQLKSRRIRDRVPENGDERSMEALHLMVVISADGVDWLLTKPISVLAILATYLFNKIKYISKLNYKTIIY